MSNWDMSLHGNVLNLTNLALTVEGRLPRNNTSSSSGSGRVTSSDPFVAGF